ncbi:MAG TPA: triose-phosphate isomerase [Phycisphaerales bacterium]|nr:triose-phosphate isomerase [Phycisphaerales bacterium]
MRTPIIGGNWKMNTTAVSAMALAEAVSDAVDAEEPAGQVAIFPPFVYLREIGEMLRAGRSRVMLGAQDVYFEADGAFTGEVSVNMLKDCGVSIVLAGHSERRHVIGESDQIVNRKARAILDAGLSCVLCVGETLAQREAGQTDEVNRRQTVEGLKGVTGEQMARVVVAYEPVWAIGTGRTATPADAQDAHRKIRAVLGALHGPEVAAATRIQYGGSMKGSNAAELFAQDDIDGGLIGGASLKADEFVTIIRAARAE